MGIVGLYTSWNQFIEDLVLVWASLPSLELVHLFYRIHFIYLIRELIQLEPVHWGTSSCGGGQPSWD